MQLIHDPLIVPNEKAQELACRVELVLQQMVAAFNDGTEMTIGDIEMATVEEKALIWQANSTIPPAVERCVHDLIAEKSALRPEAQAICAWEGAMTYSELEAASTALANHLAGLGVGPEQIVPLCFKKSLWMVVSMLAVLKAGAAFAPLDPEHPQSRQEEILRQTNAKVILASETHSTLWDKGKYTVVTVSQLSLGDMLLEPTTKTATHTLQVQPHNAAYTIFTSRSTGVPKGVIMNHSAASTGCLSHSQVFGYQQDIHVLQFSVFTFDAFINKTLTIMIYGRCICIPSEEDRRDNLIPFINGSQAN